MSQIKFENYGPIVSLEINQQYSSSIIVEHVFVIFLIIQNSKKQQLTEYTGWEMQII